MLPIFWLSAVHHQGNLGVHAYLFQRQYMPEQAYGILDQCFDDLNQSLRTPLPSGCCFIRYKIAREIPAAYRVAVLPGAWASHDPDVLRLFVERCANRAECL